MKAKEYPYLVEQVYYHSSMQGDEMSKQFIFDQLKKQGLLDKFGHPTSKAIKSGMVKEASSRVDKFKADHPALVDIPNSDFDVNDRGDISIKPKAAKKWKAKSKSVEKQLK